jgi:hypothetical protein
VTNAREYDALDAALDRLVAGLPADPPAGLEPLVQTARAAREALSLEVHGDLAAAHLEAMGIQPESAAVRPIRRRRHRLATILLAAAIGLLLLGGSAVAASGSALPGQLLYPVKRAVEKIDLALHSDPSSRARLHLEFARRRLDELGTLLAKRRAGENVDIGAAMSAYQDELSQVQDAVAADALGQDLQTLLGNVQDELAKHLSVLIALRDGTIPDEARTAIQNAIDRAQTARDSVMQGRINGGKPDGTPGATPSLGPPSQSPGKSASPHGR